MLFVFQGSLLWFWVYGMWNDWYILDFTDNDTEHRQNWKYWCRLLISQECSQSPISFYSGIIFLSIAKHPVTLTVQCTTWGSTVCKYKHTNATHTLTHGLSLRLVLHHGRVLQIRADERFSGQCQWNKEMLCSDWLPCRSVIGPNGWVEVWAA